MQRMFAFMFALLPGTIVFGQGTVLFQNSGNGIDAPVFDADGTTKLSGTNFLTQLYAGPNAATLAALGSPVPFSTNGYFFGGVVTVSNVPAGGTAVAQVRVWRASDGPTFEQAVASADAHFGASKRFETTVSLLGGAFPAYLTNLQSFSLQTLSLDSYAVQFANSGDGVDAPVFDVDGTTRLADGGYVAQLYAGFDTNSLMAQGTPVPFAADGYFQPDTVNVGNVFPDPDALVQVRVWRLGDGATFEQAQTTAGAHWGESAALDVGLINLTAPVVLTNLQSFRLTATPSVHFASINRTAAGTVQLTVSGTPGRAMIVEWSGDLKAWTGLATNVVDNTGQAQFTDTGTTAMSDRFYRARAP